MNYTPKCGDPYCSYCGDMCPGCGLPHDARQKIAILEEQVLFLRRVIDDAYQQIDVVIKMLEQEP